MRQFYGQDVAEALRANVCRLANRVAWLPEESRIYGIEAAELAKAQAEAAEEPVVASTDDEIDDVIPKGPPSARR